MRTDRGADRVRRLRIAGRALWWVGLFCLVPPLIAAWVDVRSVMRAFAALPTRVAPGSPAAASCVRLFVLRKGSGEMRRSFGAKCVSWMLGAGFLCSSASASIVYSVYVHECGRVPARGKDVHCSLYYSSTTDALASRNGRLYLITDAIGIGEDTGLSWSAEAGGADPLSGMWEVRWESGVGRLLLHTPGTYVGPDSALPAQFSCPR